MTNTRWLVVLAAVAMLSAAARGEALTTRETPRATDLLRAQKLADQVEKRLQLPAKHGSGWRPGGGGWEADDPPSPKAPGSVTIRVQQPRRRRPSAE